MDHFVRLDQLPSDLEFPQKLNERIRYDNERKGLVYRDAMSSNMFETLLHLHTDSDYRRAIEELFRIAVYQSDKKRQRTSKNIQIYIGLGLVAAALAVVVAFWIFYGS